MDSKLSSIWEDRLAQYETSGKSITAWCKEQTIRENQFYYWRKKLRTGQAEKNQLLQWLTFDSQVGPQSSIDAEILNVQIGKATVKVHKGFDQALLREIVQVLQTI